MISGILPAIMRWIWSFSRSLLRFRRASSSWSEPGSAESSRIRSSSIRCSAFSASISTLGWSSFIGAHISAAGLPPKPNGLVDDPHTTADEKRIGSRQSGRFVVYYSAVTPAYTKGLAPMDQANVEELESQHAALHAMIEEEEHRAHPDEDLLHRLKKEK